jgi:hypothetical protein
MMKKLCTNSPKRNQDKEQIFHKQDTNFKQPINQINKIKQNPDKNYSEK